MTRIIMASVSAATLAIAASAGAQDKGGADSAPPAAYQQVAQCRSVADPTERLACYDRSVTALDQALTRHDVVIADRAEVQKTKRGLFGFTAPIGHFLGLGDKDGADEIKQIDTTVTAVRHTRDGWLLTFAEGGTWQQIDLQDFPLSPKVGNKARISRGALGSYFISVDGMNGRKFRRVE